MDLCLLANSTSTAIQSIIALKQHQLNNTIDDLFTNFEKNQNEINSSFLLKIDKKIKNNEQIYNFIENNEANFLNKNYKNNNEENLLEIISEIIDRKNKLLVEKIEKKIEKSNENIITKINNLDINIKELLNKKKKKIFF